MLGCLAAGVVAALGGCDGDQADAELRVRPAEERPTPGVLPEKTATQPALPCDWIPAGEVEAVVGKLTGPPRKQEGGAASTWRFYLPARNPSMSGRPRSGRPRPHQPLIILTVPLDRETFFAAQARNRRVPDWHDRSDSALVWIDAVRTVLPFFSG